MFFFEYIFSSDVDFFAKMFSSCENLNILSCDKNVGMISLGDYYGHGRSSADVGGHRGAARRYHQARELHQGAPRHVYGYGHAR